MTVVMHPGLLFCIGGTKYPHCIVLYCIVLYRGAKPEPVDTPGGRRERRLGE